MLFAYSFNSLSFAGGVLCKLDEYKVTVRKHALRFYVSSVIIVQSNVSIVELT